MALVLPLCIVPELFIVRLQLINLLLHQIYHLALLAYLVFVLCFLLIHLCNLSTQRLKLESVSLLGLIVSYWRV